MRWLLPLPNIVCLMGDMFVSCMELEELCFVLDAGLPIKASKE